jgi:hypothetical protein
MKVDTRKIRKKLTGCFTVFIAIFALLIAGSDGPYFPWPNLAGIGVMTVIAFITAWEEEKLEWLEKDASEDNIGKSDCRQSPATLTHRKEDLSWLK